MPTHIHTLSFSLSLEIDLMSSLRLRRKEGEDMALNAFQVKTVSDVPNADRVAADRALALPCPVRLSAKRSGGAKKWLLGKGFAVIGHRGSGMNMLQLPDWKMKAIKENSLLAFNAAGKFNLDFIEFDVQVTKDDCPVIFHDNFILAEEKDGILERRVTDLTVEEFLSYGPQRNAANVVKPMLRKTKDGRIWQWKVENDDPLCTLRDVFERVVDHSLGFNVELKFDDDVIYQEDQLIHILQQVLRVVLEFAEDRPILFSSFQPDAALLMRQLQNAYPVFFITNGGSQIYKDKRRNSLDEAIKLSLAGGLHGIVSEVKGILRNLEAISKIKESQLSLISYGQLNNVREVVQMQHLMGVEGVIVDLIREITEAVTAFVEPPPPLRPAPAGIKEGEGEGEGEEFEYDKEEEDKEDDDEEEEEEEKGGLKVAAGLKKQTPCCCSSHNYNLHQHQDRQQQQLSSLLKLIPEMIQLEVNGGHLHPLLSETPLTIQTI